MTPELSRKLATYVLEELHIAPESVKELESIHYDELAIAAYDAVKRLMAETGQRIMYGPVADMDFYFGHPFNNGFIQETKDVPVMCGSVFGEFMNNFASPVGEGSKNSWSEEYKQELLKQEYGDRTDAVVAAFRKAYPEKNIADILFMDAGMRQGAIDFAVLRAKSSGAGVYNFMFNLESPFNGGTVPWHNAEIPYVFHNAEYLEPSFIPGVTEKLQDIVSGAWVNFAWNGDPNGGAVPGWEKVTEETIATMLFDRECVMKVNHDRELMELAPTRKADMSKLMGAKK